MINRNQHLARIIRRKNYLDSLNNPTAGDISESRQLAVEIRRLKETLDRREGLIEVFR